MQISILGYDSAAGKTVEISDVVFQEKFNESLVHQAVTSCLAGFRSGTKAQKTRAEVRGGGKKPWQQKGTGRARAGSIRSPLWRGGGKTFAAKPRDFSQKMNKRMYRGALRSIFAELLRQDRFFVVDTINIDAPKTKLMIEQLNQWNLENVLIVVDHLDFDLYLAARNLPHVEVIDTDELNPVALVNYQHIVVTIPALRNIEDRLS